MRLRKQKSQTLSPLEDMVKNISSLLSPFKSDSTSLSAKELA